jgi:imidazolonepropionase-like amidohydrolase
VFVVAGCSRENAYVADLLLVRGDPTSDVLAIRDIVRVWKSGVEVDRMIVGR